MKRTFRMRILRKILLGIALAAVLTYAGDDVSLRVRHGAYADVRIDRVLALAQNFNRVGYERMDPITERCVYALFPHSGHNPCWYVMRHTVRLVEVG